MIDHSQYTTSQLSSIQKGFALNNTYSSPLQSLTSERNLLTSIFHMMLGLSSDIFTLKNNKFAVNQLCPHLHHLSQQALRLQLQRLAEMGNNIQLIRIKGNALKSCDQKMLQAFGMGLHDVQRDIQTVVTSKLMILHQQEGQIQRTQAKIFESRQQPTSLLSISSYLSKEQQKLTLSRQILSQLPIESATNQQLQRCSIFLLNFYFKQCQLQHLSEMQFPLHTPFKRCLQVYVEICQAWIQFSPSKLQSYANSGFFMDLNRALSMDSERFFDINKMISRQMVPQLFSKSFKRIIQVGKTVQFIKLYFNQHDLLAFYQYLDVDHEFQAVNNLLFCQHEKTITSYTHKRKQLTLSSRCSQPNKQIKPKVQKMSDNPFGIFDSSPSFFHLRSIGTFSHPSISYVQDNQSLKQMPVQNMKFSHQFQSLLERMALKCKIVLKQKKIKESIQQTLRCIKNYVLLGQGDFVHQFIELSQTVLEKSTEKISKNNVERIIEEAIKTSSQAPYYEDVRQSLSFVFLRSEASISKGWKAFSFTFKSQIPVNFIFNASTMHDYESIGNLLFSLRHCQHSFVSFWKKSMRVNSSILLKTRLALQRFLNSLQTYLFTLVEQQWNNLLEAFDNCDSILTFLEANQVFLEQLKKQTVQNRPLCNSMLSLVKIVQKLETLEKRMEDRSFKSDVEMELVWSWFLSLMDQAKQIPQLVDTFDFSFGSQL